MPQTLSVCMIVKNEEEFLADCLKSVAPVADQIVVVDTGSTDRTVEIARSFDAQVYPFEWCDDFSAARNASIEHATGDWILWLDADERLRPESIPVLKKLLRAETKPTAYIVQIWNRMADGKNYKLSTAHRLFTNHKGIRFHGRIHEQIAYSVAQLKGTERESAVVLEHLGYGLPPEKREKKNQRNLRLLQKMVAEQPKNAYAHYTLAQQFHICRRFEEALRHFQIAYRLKTLPKNIQGTLLNVMAEGQMELNRPEEAKRTVEQSLNRFPRQVGGYYLMYKIAVSQNRLDAAYGWLQKMYENNEYLRTHPKSLSTDILIHRDVIILEMVKVLVRLQNWSAAAEWLDKLSPQAKQEKTARELRVKLFLGQNQLQQAEKLLTELNRPPQPAYLEQLALVQIKQQKFLQAIETYRQLLQLQPDNSQAVRRLAGLYAKTGHPEIAQTLLAASHT